ncbi:MAG TPA: anti-sigma factor antagonist [Deltaproteobacteria bacterium]|nr:anti-sigma factor antagonist [Deltaproteobacteria bacterium]
MEINTRKERDVTIVSVTGRMGEVTAPAFEEKMRKYIADEKIKFIVDFKELEYISSAGLRSILAIAKMLKDKNGTMVLSSLTGAVKEVFEITQFVSIFTIYDNTEDALSEI